EAAVGGDRKIGLPLGLGGIGIGVEHEGSAKGHPAVGGADVEDVAGVAVAGVAGGIDVVNYAVERGRLTPAHVSPVSGVAVHGGEVARSATAGAIEGGAGVGVGPGVAAVGGPKDEVRARSEAPAAFVHAGDIHVARGQVAGDLDVADEWGAAGQLSRVGPGGAVVSGIADEEGASPDIEVVPGDVHPPVEGRARVVVCPARLSVVVGVVVNAEMGPAIRVR